MCVVFAEELESSADTKGHVIQSLEQAFAQSVCQSALAHNFEQEQEG